MDDGKKSMLILHANTIKQIGKGMALISIDGSERQLTEKSQSIQPLKEFGLNGPIVKTSGKKFNNAMSAMGLSNQSS
jgi:hypothetical protein